MWSDANTPGDPRYIRRRRIDPSCFKAEYVVQTLRCIHPGVFCFRQTCIFVVKAEGDKNLMRTILN